MAKRKVTVTIDAQLLDRLRQLSDAPLSQEVNAALGLRVADLEHHRGLGLFLDEHEAKYGLPSDEAMAWAQQAFDEADGIVPRSGTDAA